MLLRQGPARGSWRPIGCFFNGLRVVLASSQTVLRVWQLRDNTALISSARKNYVLGLPQNPEKPESLLVLGALRLPRMP